MNSLKIKNNRGFTLIELLVVIAIIGLLSSVVLASLTSARDKAKNAKALQEVYQLQTALELYRADNGEYPFKYPVPGNGGYYPIYDAGVWATFVSALSPYLDVTKLTSMVNYDPNGPNGSSNIHYMPPNSPYFYGSGYYDWQCGNPTTGVTYQPPPGSYLMIFYSSVPLTLDNWYHSGSPQGGYYCFTEK